MNSESNKISVVEPELILFETWSRSRNYLFNSVAEPPLFWAAPAPDGQGPEADSSSDLLGSALAPGKKRRLQVASAPYTKSFSFKLSKS